MELMFSASMMFISSECGLRTLRPSTGAPETELGDPLDPTVTETCGNGPRRGIPMSEKEIFKNEITN